MVLQSTTNSRQLLKKRALNSNSENTPPNKLRRVSVSIREASRRRRARVVSGDHTPAHITHKYRYAYDVKHRKAKSASNARLRFQFVSSKLPAIQDVEMMEAESLDVRLPKAGASTAKTTVVLPRHLPRPEFKDINRDILAAIEPEFAETPIEYIHDGLEALGPDMYKVLTGVKPQPVTNALPKELAIIINDMTSDMPSHMLAVYAQSPTTSSTFPQTHRKKVTLFPSHNVILASHCANLPLLPSANHPAPETPGSSITVPVVPLCIPAPELYTPLSVYLYTKRLDLLLQSLLPTLPSSPLNVYTSPDESSEEATKQREGLLSFARRLAVTYTPHALLSYAMRVNGFWRNVCALGIFESKIWGAMDFAWEVLLLAIAVATGNVEQVLDKPIVAQPDKPHVAQDFVKPFIL